MTHDEKKIKELTEKHGYVNQNKFAREYAEHIRKETETDMESRCVNVAMILLRERGFSPGGIIVFAEDMHKKLSELNESE